MKHSVTLDLPTTTANRNGQQLVHCLMQFIILFCTIQIQICFFSCILFSLCIGTAVYENCLSGIFKFSFSFFF